MRYEIAHHPAERAQLVEPKSVVATYRDGGTAIRKADGLGALLRQEEREPAVGSGAQANEERFLDRLDGCDDGGAGVPDDTDCAATTELAERTIDLERLSLAVDPDFGVGLAAVEGGHDC
jgi:hypothetical protein